MRDASTLRRRAGRWRSVRDVYVARSKTSVQFAMQYRVSLVADLLLTTAEPIVYLAVWQLVAEANGGQVDGFTPERFAAYYITFGFVRLCLQTGAPANWQYAIQRGDLSAMLLQPLHPVHLDMATYMGYCFTRAVMWLPVGAVLVLVYEPEFQTSPLQVLGFAVSLVPAYVMRTLINDVIGFAAFWFVSIAAFEGIAQIAESILSGRLVPLELYPDWLQQISRILPFEWGFAFPINALIGPMSHAELAQGLAIQLGWTVTLWLLMRLVWARGVRRYGAVGG